MIPERVFNISVIGIVGLMVAWALLTESHFTLTLMTRTTILALAAVGLNIALGLGGLVSFGHAVFFGLGGYSVGILAFHAQTFTPLIEWPFEVEGTNLMPITWLVAVVVSSIAALIIGALSLRTSGVYFIMITLAFGQMFYFFAISWPAYGGEDGLPIPIRGAFPGVNTFAPLPYFILCAACLAFGLFVASRLAASPFGLSLKSARQVSARVEAVGLDPQRIKLVAFVISGAITGLAGALFADLNRFVSPAMYSWQLSGELIVLVIIGGVGRLFGPVVGAIVFVLLEHLLGGLLEFWHIYLGLILLLIVLFGRGGLIGAFCGQSNG